MEEACADDQVVNTAGRTLENVVRGGLKINICTGMKPWNAFDTSLVKRKTGDPVQVFYRSHPCRKGESVQLAIYVDLLRGEASFRIWPGMSRSYGKSSSLKIEMRPERLSILHVNHLPIGLKKMR